MALDTYYKDHWVEIEPDRLERYEDQFVWGERGNRLLESAEIETGQTVADYGCGPGYVSIELAKRVGETGFVHSFDINPAVVNI